MSLVLIGYRASGKTTVGRLLAHQLGRPFVDSDDRIVQRAGKTIAKIFTDHGEPHFRDLESAVVREVAALNDHVIALGGGALGRPENLAAIQTAAHKIVYLRCDPSELLRRIQSDPSTAAARPPLSQLGGDLREIEQILSQREPLWRRAMHAELDVSELTPEESVAGVIKMM